MAANHNSASDALSKVRATPKPYCIRVTDEDGKESQIRTPDVKRWKSRVAKVLETMQWRSICPIDESGAMVDSIIENRDYEEFANDLEDISGVDMSAPIAYLDQMLKAQSVALDRQSAAYESVLRHDQVMMDIQLKRTLALEKVTHEQLETIRKLHEQINESDGGESGSGDQMALEVVKLVGAVQSAQAGVSDVK